MRIVEKSSPRLYPECVEDPFFSIAPHAKDGIKKARAQLQGRTFKREALADALLKYNQKIGNDTAALGQIKRLREETTDCVLTGQQLGLMGGPSYTILKGISCLLLAREAGSIPIFWLATDDHDTDEISHTTLLDTLGNLRRFHISLPHQYRMVESLRVEPHHRAELRAFLETVDMATLIDIADEASSYTDLMVKILVHWFSGTGLVFVEPKVLRPFATPFFQKEIQNTETLQHLVKETSSKLIALGEKAPINPEVDNRLFLTVEGKYRRKIIKQGERFHSGDRTYSEKELLERAEKEPECFSAGVASRPLFQSFILPTLAYVAGPSEMRYHRQLIDTFRELDLPMPWVVPRLSATLIPPYAAQLLTACKLDPWEPVPHHWHDVFPTIEAGMETVEVEWAEVARKHFASDLSDEEITRYTRHGLQGLKKRLYGARLHAKNVPKHALHYLRNLLTPHGKLQERVLNWAEFQAQTKENLVQALVHQLDWKRSGHLYLFLEN